MIAVLSCSSGSLTNLHPVGRFIKCSFESLIDERFEKKNRVFVPLNPIVLDLFCHFRKDMACEEFDFNPWQNEKAGIVGCEDQISLPFLGIPSDQLIPRGDLPCGSSKKQTCQRPLPSVENKILSSLSRASLVTDIMISVKQAFEKIAINRIFADVDNLKGDQLLQFFVDGIGSVKNVRNVAIS